MSIFKVFLVAIISSSIVSAGGKGVVEVDTTPIPIIEESPFYYAGLKFGTLGVGVDFAIPLSQSFFLRLNVNGAKLNIDTTREGVDYNSDVELLTAGAMLDYYPYGDGEFHISAGAYYYDNKAKSRGTVAPATYNIGGTPYAITSTDYVDVTLDFPKFAPYVGIGYGGREENKGWNWGIDIGVMYHGDGDIALDPHINSVAVSLADIETERQNMQDEVRKIPIYPVVMVGLTYSF